MVSVRVQMGTEQHCVSSHSSASIVSLWCFLRKDSRFLRKETMLVRLRDNFAAGVPFGTPFWKLSSEQRAEKSVVRCESSFLTIHFREFSSERGSEKSSVRPLCHATGQAWKEARFLRRESVFRWGKRLLFLLERLLFSARRCSLDSSCFYFLTGAFSFPPGSF